MSDLYTGPTHRVFALHGGDELAIDCGINRADDLCVLHEGRLACGLTTFLRVLSVVNDLTEE